MGKRLISNGLDLKVRKRPAPVAWRCPQCQVKIAKWWNHCPGCNHPRVVK